MNTKLKLEDVPEALRATDGAFVKDILNVNWKPHPFMIGGRHVTYAADHNSGMLTKEVCEKIPCAAPRCHQPYDAHVCDTVALIALTKDMEQEPLRQWLLQLTPVLPDLEGFTFLETGFRVLPPKGEPDA